MPQIAVVYHFKLHREKSGYWAECLELQGCATEGDSREERANNAREALNLYLDEPEDSPAAFPLPGSYSGSNIMKVSVEPRLGLAVQGATIDLDVRTGGDLNLFHGWL